MNNVINLREYKNRCELDTEVGYELLKQLVFDAENHEKTEEYNVFLSAIKALQDSSENKNVKLNMKILYDKEKSSLSYTFKFEK